MLRRRRTLLTDTSHIWLRRNPAIAMRRLLAFRDLAGPLNRRRRMLRLTASHRHPLRPYRLLQRVHPFGKLRDQGPQLCNLVLLRHSPLQ